MNRAGVQARSTSPSGIDGADLFRLPWSFTQRRALTTMDLKREAARRGVTLDGPVLRELYRRQVLIPLILVPPTPRGANNATPFINPFDSAAARAARSAAHRGRAIDLDRAPYRPRLRFSERRRDDPKGWWNGLLYSPWQLLALASAGPRIARGRWTAHREPLFRLPGDLPDRQVWWRWRRTAILLSALEAKYLPSLDPVSGTVRNALDMQGWEDYAQGLEPGALAQRLAVTPAELATMAEDLLSQADSLNQVGDWWQLLAHAPRREADMLTGAALLSAEHRSAAQMLLDFHKDLQGEHSAPIPADGGRRCRHPLDAAWAEAKKRPLDDVLSDLGVSPHPRVVVIIEGESEERIFPRVLCEIAPDLPPHLVRVVCMRGADRDLQLLAAYIAAPLLGPAGPDGCHPTIRPLTHIVVALDPDQGWSTAENLAKKKNLIINEIKRVVLAQGVTLDEGIYQDLITIVTWEQSCFEYEHFTDDQLAEAMHEVLAVDARWDLGQTKIKLAESRAQRRDVKGVIALVTGHESGKVKLAEALWPILRRRLRTSESSKAASYPTVALVLADAVRLAMELAPVRIHLPAASRGE